MISSFDLKYDLLSSANPGLGSIAIVPWDSKLFNFNIGQYKIGRLEDIVPNKNILINKLGNWAKEKKVKLVGCEIDSNLTHLIPILQELKFYFVDSTFEMSLNKLDKMTLHKLRYKVRLFKKNDVPKIIKIARSSFSHGKYHADSLFSDDLAGLRYEYWIKNAMDNNSKKNHVYVIEVKNDIKGFFHVLCDQEKADIRLVAIETKHQNSILGYFLSVGVFNILKKKKINKLIVKISSTNLSMLNIYTSFGFKCKNNRLLFHKHINYNF